MTKNFDFFIKFYFLAYWTTEKVFLRVYPCELAIADTTFQKGAPEILRRKEHCMDKFREYEEEMKKVKMAITNLKEQ